MNTWMAESKTSVDWMKLNLGEKGFGFSHASGGVCLDPLDCSIVGVYASFDDKLKSCVHMCF